MTLHKQIFAVVLLALFLRVLDFSFPAFTAEEASIAFRGYTLSKGVDELGRSFPYLFNSQIDYRLPLTSYISALGAVFFGKSEMAARIPFIIIGFVLVLLTYKVSTQLSKEKSFHIFSTFIVAISPVLIFVSKVPNEPIVATTLLLWLFYLLNKNKLNSILIFLIIILLILTSKSSWFIVTPFVIYTVFIYRNTLNLRDKLKLSLISLTFASLAFVLFLQVPQGARSLSENNFSLFSDITIKNGINRIRGQGRESGWPPILGKILVNKSHFFAAGSLHWLSNIQPAVFFSQFDENANLSFVSMGAFPKTTIIPAIIGILFLIRIRSSKLLLYPFLIVLPSALIYPKFSPEVVILTLPFVAYTVAFGFLQMNGIFRSLILTLLMLELFSNFLFLSPQVKFTNDFRPEWIKPIVQEAFNLSDTGQVLISDDIAQDITSFIEWYTPFNPEDAFLDIPYPYKFRQTNLGKIKLVGASDNFRSCGLGENTKFFSSKRDLNRVKTLNSIQVTSTYLNSREEVVAYFIERGVCIN